MKIIDWKAKGNVVRYFLGADDLDEWYGDDWDDAPYEHNAEEVYDQFVKGYMDVAYPFDTVVLEPCDGEWNSPWCKDDMIARRVPIIITNDTVDPYDWDTDDFKSLCADASTHRVYMGDHVDDNDPRVHLVKNDDKQNGEQPNT